MLSWKRGRAGASARQCIYPRTCTVGALAVGLTLAGCVTNGPPTASLAMAHGNTVAFESIEGPPNGVFRKLVDALANEAETRQVAFVSREDQAQYRVRGYLAAHIQKKRTTIAWVWDVYDGEQRRTLRLTGEQAADGSGWAAADEKLIRQIARDGMDRLVAFLAAPDAEPTRAVPDASPETAVSALESAPPVGLIAAYSPARTR